MSTLALADAPADASISLTNPDGLYRGTFENMVRALISDLLEDGEPVKAAIDTDDGNRAIAPVVAISTHDGAITLAKPIGETHVALDTIVGVHVL